MIFLMYILIENGHSRDMFMFLDSAAKNYPGFLQDQNKHATFDILAEPRGST